MCVPGVLCTNSENKMLIALKAVVLKGTVDRDPMSEAETLAGVFFSCQRGKMA